MKCKIVNFSRRPVALKIQMNSIREITNTISIAQRWIRRSRGISLEISAIASSQLHGNDILGLYLPTKILNGTRGSTLISFIYLKKKKNGFYRLWIAESFFNTTFLDVWELGHLKYWNKEVWIMNLSFCNRNSKSKVIWSHCIFFKLTHASQVNLPYLLFLMIKKYISEYSNIQKVRIGDL